MEDVLEGIVELGGELGSRGGFGSVEGELGLAGIAWVVCYRGVSYVFKADCV